VHGYGQHTNTPTADHTAITTRPPPRTRPSLFYVCASNTQTADAMTIPTRPLWIPSLVMATPISSTNRLCVFRKSMGLIPLFLTELCRMAPRRLSTVRLARPWVLAGCLVGWPYRPSRSSYFESEGNAQIEEEIHHGRC